MGNSMLEELKKAGLVDDNRIRQVKSEKYKTKKKTGKNPQADDARKLAQKARNDQAQRDRELNQKRGEEANRKAIAAQVKQLVETNRITERDGELVYNFTAGKKVKRLYFSEDVHKNVSTGQLIIVNLNGRYELVPPDIADKIKARDERCVVVDNRGAVSKTSNSEDDPYADYQVPDDLMW